MRYLKMHQRPGYLRGLGAMNQKPSTIVTTGSSVTSQTAIGTAKGEYDLVAFNLSIEGQGSAGPEAKAEVQRIIEQALKPALVQLAHQGISFQDQTSTFVVSQNYSYEQGEQQLVGYKALYTLHLETEQTDQVSEIQDILTSLDGVAASSPQFILQDANRQQLQQDAVKNAFNLVGQRFAYECSILGLNPADFEIAEWEAHYHDPTNDSFPAAFLGAATGMSRSAGSPISIDTGSAIVQMNLRVGYRRK